MKKSNHLLLQPSQHSRGRKPDWGLMGLLFLGMTGLLLGMSGCASKVFYTQEFRVLVDSAHIDPRRLQFYNDKEFLIRRKTVSKEVKSTEGVVTNTEGIRVTDVRIRRGTPCRVDSVSGNNYFVRFEIGEGCVLRFYKNTYDHYQIGADKWVAGRGQIVYGGKDYVIERVGNDCLLQVKNYQTFRDQKRRNVARGVEVGTEDAQIRDSIEVDNMEFDE